MNMYLRFDTNLKIFENCLKKNINAVNVPCIIKL